MTHTKIIYLFILEKGKRSHFIEKSCCIPQNIRRRRKKLCIGELVDGTSKWEKVQSLQLAQQNPQQ